MNWDRCELTIEDCQYFQKALQYIFARGLKTDKGEMRTLHGFDISSIFEKTDGDWDWQDFGSRWTHDIDAQRIFMKEITDKLTAFEIDTVRLVARREKQLERLGMEYYIATISRRENYARRPEAIRQNNP